MRLERRILDISATAVNSLSPCGRGLGRGHGLSIGRNPSPGSHLSMRHSRSFASAFFFEERPPKAAYASPTRGEVHRARGPTIPSRPHTFAEPLDRGFRAALAVRDIQRI